MFDLDADSVAAIVTIIGAITTMAVTIIRELRGLQQAVVAQTEQMQRSDVQKIQLSQRIAAAQLQSAPQPVNLISQSAAPDVADLLARLERRLATVEDRPAVAAPPPAPVEAPASIEAPDWATQRAARAEANR